MSQRVAAAASGAGGDGTEGTQAPPVQQYPQVNPLMPNSLRLVPPWYEWGQFRHNTRLLLGVLPGAILLVTVSGTP